jgi:hypothetical protein
MPRSYRWFPELLPFLNIWCQMCHLEKPLSLTNVRANLGPNIDGT